MGNKIDSCVAFAVRASWDFLFVVVVVVSFISSRTSYIFRTWCPRFGAYGACVHNVLHTIILST